MCKHVSMLSPLPSLFLLRRSGTALLGISTASLVSWYVVALCWVSAEHAGNAMVVVEGLAKQAGTSLSAEGYMSCCVCELRIFATREGDLPPPTWERGAEALFTSPERHYTLLINIGCCQKVINFDESEGTELQFCKPWGFGSSPFLLLWNTLLALFDMRCCWCSYSCRVMTCLCSWLCHCECIVHACVFTCLRCTIQKYLCVGISGSVRWGCVCVCVCICGNCCVFCLLPDILVAIVQWSICEHPEDHCYS